MRKGADIGTCTADEIRPMPRRGEDRTDWAKVDAMTEADLERAIAEDQDERDLEPDWTRESKRGLTPFLFARSGTSGMP